MFTLPCACTSPSLFLSPSPGGCSYCSYHEDEENTPSQPLSLRVYLTTSLPCQGEIYIHNYNTCSIHRSTGAYNSGDVIHYYTVWQSADSHPEAHLHIPGRLGCLLSGFYGCAGGRYSVRSCHTFMLFLCACAAQAVILILFIVRQLATYEIGTANSKTQHVT